jgi:hypothetical protein
MLDSNSSETEEHESNKKGRITRPAAIFQGYDSVSGSGLNIGGRGPKKAEMGIRVWFRCRKIVKMDFIKSS